MNIFISGSMLTSISFIILGFITGRMVGWSPEYIIAISLIISYSLGSLILFFIAKSNMNKMAAITLLYVSAFLSFLPIIVIFNNLIFGFVLFGNMFIIVNRTFRKTILERVNIVMLISSAIFIAYIVVASEVLGNYLALPWKYFYPLGVLALINASAMLKLNKTLGEKVEQVDPY